MPRVLLFDMDGTLTNPGVGITSSYQALLKELGHEPPSMADLRWTIGPSLRECLKKLLNTDDADFIERCVLRYRYYYVDQKLMLNDAPYAGVAAVLEKLKKDGSQMFVATGKAHIYAKAILDHFGLLGFFAGVYGPELDGTRSNKSELLAWLFERECVAPSAAVMIGDRHHDIDAAKAHGVPSIGITYGYGTREELEGAGAHYLADTPDQILSLLQRWP